MSGGALVPRSDGALVYQTEQGHELEDFSEYLPQLQSGLMALKILRQDFASAPEVSREVAGQIARLTEMCDRYHQLVMADGQAAEERYHQLVVKAIDNQQSVINSQQHTIDKLTDALTERQEPAEYVLVGEVRSESRFFEEMMQSSVVFAVVGTMVLLGFSWLLCMGTWAINSITTPYPARHSALPKVEVRG